MDEGSESRDLLTKRLHSRPGSLERCRKVGRKPRNTGLGDVGHSFEPSEACLMRRHDARST